MIVPILSAQRRLELLDNPPRPPARRSTNMVEEARRSAREELRMHRLYQRGMPFGQRSRRVEQILGGDTLL